MLNFPGPGFNIIGNRKSGDLPRRPLPCLMFNFLKTYEKIFRGLGWLNRNLKCHRAFPFHYGDGKGMCRQVGQDAHIAKALLSPVEPGFTD